MPQLRKKAVRKTPMPNRKVRKNKMQHLQRRTSLRPKRKTTTQRASRRRPQNQRQPRMQPKRKLSLNRRSWKRQKARLNSQWNRKSLSLLRSLRVEQRQQLPWPRHRRWRRSKSKKLAWPLYTLSLRILRSREKPSLRVIAQSTHSLSMKTMLPHKSSSLNSKIPLMNSSIYLKEFWILS